MTYSRGAVERAMKVQEVILRAIDGKLTWVQAADILGYSPRTIRRLRRRLKYYGYDGLLDRRRQLPSPKRAPVVEVQRLLTLYRERYLGFNVRHFHQLARREHGGRFCYAFVKKALQTAGLVAKHQPRGRHRRRREPRPCFGELLHLDGSRHHWLARQPAQWFTLIAMVDDATKRLVYAALHEGGESVAAIMTALRAEPQPAEDVPSQNGRCSLLELGKQKCRWPISQPCDVAFWFCGNKPVDGLPYCAGHARIAYRATSSANHSAIGGTPGRARANAR